MKYLLYLLYFIGASYSCYAQDNSSNKGTLKTTKCYTLIQGIKNSGRDVDTIKSFRNIVFNLSSSCPENRIVSFESIISCNGLSKTFASHNSNFTPEMMVALSEFHNNVGSIVIQKVRTLLPDGTTKYIDGETLLVLPNSPASKTIK